MTKLEQMQRIEACGIVAIIRANSANELIETAAAIHAGGVNVIEVTMTTPNALQVINDVSSAYGDAVLVGAGSVLDAETARAVMLAGAEFIVSPVTKPDVIEICNRYGKVVIPGAFTPTEILAAWEAGADYVKVFPSSGVGPCLYKRRESTAASDSSCANGSSAWKTLLISLLLVLPRWALEVRLLIINLLHW